LYQVECETPFCYPGERIRLKHGSTRSVIPRPTAGGTQLANLAAASTFYVSPSGELLFYATEHDNDGPRDSVKAGEWRHVDVVRENSPTLQPTIVPSGPNEVDEGRVGTVGASGEPPVTRAWIQLFDGLDFGGRVFQVVDYDDYGLDNFDMLNRFQIDPPQYPFGFYGVTRSWTWYAPLGCSIQAIAEAFDVPRETVTLTGTGRVERAADLRAVSTDSGSGNMDRRVSGVDFLEDCDRYYSTPLVLQWDLDGNGSYETSGNDVSFDATELDGPAVIEVPVQGGIPSRAGGPSTRATVAVGIRNLAPEFRRVTVTNAAGRRVGVEVPFVLTGLPVRIRATFTDLGRPDRQTAAVNWGDGEIEQESDFDRYRDAFGGALGRLSHRHRYFVSGQYGIRLSVTDDDGATAGTETVVRVLTPAQAVEEIVRLLDALIETTPHRPLLHDLENARRALAGRPGADNKGALGKLVEGKEKAALAKLREAIRWLEKAQQKGGSVATPIDLLEEVIAALQI
jgi:hypothetical protein